MAIDSTKGKKIPSTVIALEKQYNDSQTRMLKLIQETEAKGNSTAYQREILAGINEEIRVLDEFVYKWKNDALPEAFLQGAEQTFRQYRKMGGVNATQTTGTSGILDNLMSNMLGSMTEANQFVGRTVNDALKKVSLEATSQSLSMGGASKMTEQLFRAAMSAHGLTAIVDRNGRKIDLGVYARMMARTTAAEATNAGILQQLEDVDCDLMEIDSTNTTCPVCAVYEGRVYSVSGKDKRFPPMSRVFKAGRLNIHPNCTHALIPYIEEFDDNHAETVTNSNRSFELTKKDDAMLERYYADQEKKAAKRRDMVEWQSARTVAPDTTPKTLSAYRSMKKAKSKKFTEVRAAVKAAKTEV